MNEVTIISGRMNPRVDPHLEIWHWEIPFYLFMGGLAAGILFFAAMYVLLNKEEKFAAAVRFTPHFAPFILVLGLIALLLDLNHKAYFWQLYTTIRLQSPMSWGAWVLMLITPLSFIWSAIHIRTVLPNWEWKGILKTMESFFVKQKKPLPGPCYSLGDPWDIYRDSFFGFQCPAALEYFYPGSAISGIRTFNGCCHEYYFLKGP